MLNSARSVYGDPKASNEVHITLDRLLVALTCNCHILASAGADLSHQSLAVASTAFLLCISAEIRLSYPMYRGQATPSNPQQTVLDAEARGVSVTVGQTTMSLLAGLEGIPGVLIAEIPHAEVSLHSTADGESVASQHAEGKAADIRCNMSVRQYACLFHLAWSWVGDHVHTDDESFFPPLPVPKPERRLTVQLSGVSAEWVCNASKACYSGALTQCTALLSVLEGEEGCLYVPVMQWPSDTCSWNSVELVESNFSKEISGAQTGGSTRAAEINLVLPERGKFDG